MSQSLGPWRITFDTNPDDCNLSCIMCEDHSPFSNTRCIRIKNKQSRRRMDIELIKKVLAEAKHTELREIIPSTMGEPLLYKDFQTIIELCHHYGLKLNLTTNGTFPKLGAVAWAKLLVPVCSDIKISWNGATQATQESIMLGSRWHDMLANLKTLIAIRDTEAKAGGNYCRVTLQLTFLESNVDELADIVQLGVDYGVDRIKGHHLWAHFTEIKTLSMRRSAVSIQRWNQAVKVAKKVAATQLLPNGRPIQLDNIFELDEQHADQDIAPGAVCPFLGKEAWIAADGRFNPCCAPDKARRQLGDFGNVNTTSIQAIWQSEAYQELCQNYMQHDICRHCNMRRPKEST